MSRMIKNLKLAQALFPILTAAVLAAACGSDSTGPITDSDEGSSGTTETPSVDSTPPVDGTTPPVDGTTPPAAPPAGAPAASKASAPGTANLEYSVASTTMMGDLGPCQWTGSWCVRWVSLNDPAYLWLAIEFTSNYVVIWEFDYAAGQWELHYAVNRYDLSTWYWNGQWIPYQPYDVQLSPTTVSIGNREACAVAGGELCYYQMLDPSKWLMNGTSVVDFLRRLTSGT